MFEEPFVWFLLVVVAACVVIIWILVRQRGERAGAIDQMHRAGFAALNEQAQESAAVLRDEATKLVEDAKARAAELLAEADGRRAELESSLVRQRAELQELRTVHERREARLQEREDQIAAEIEGFQVRSASLEERRAELAAARDALRTEQSEVEAERERLAGITAEQARLEVLAEAERAARIQATTISRDIEATARKEGNDIARKIIVDAIQRLASAQTSESVVSTVDLPSDEMKGRIIGREGRNIRVFEQITGVNVMIDDTPESVLLSGFDPVRREIARLTLVDLVTDGRIHPARIEEVYERNVSRIAERIEREAEDALAEVGISDLHPELIPVIGSLAYRTSYGQSVLRHLVESAHLAALMAAELGLDIATCKRAAFLHDIGKALTHEVEGSHAMIGADLARRYGEHPDIVHAIEAHHNEVAPQTVEAVLTQAADAISGSRPGARRESLEAYVERMQRLESIAAEHAGVEKVYAMQAGREVRVMVAPEEVDDLAAQTLAKDIAREIETALNYPGQIKITVVRESRATELAH